MRCSQAATAIAMAACYENRSNGHDQLRTEVAVLLERRSCRVEVEILQSHRGGGASPCRSPAQRRLAARLIARGLRRRRAADGDARADDLAVEAVPPRVW